MAIRAFQPHLQLTHKTAPNHEAGTNEHLQHHCNNNSMATKRRLSRTSCSMDRGAWCLLDCATCAQNVAAEWWELKVCWLQSFGLSSRIASSLSHRLHPAATQPALTLLLHRRWSSEQCSVCSIPRA